MKTTLLCSPAPDEGSGSLRSNGGIPAAIQRGNDLKAGIVAPPESAGPHYDQGLQYGTVRYPGDPLTTPVADGGRVKMSLDTRNNENLSTFVANHITQMTGNANFTTPMPPAVDFAAIFASFQTAHANWVSMKTACDDASVTLTAMRLALTEAMNARGAYVQTTSNGNRQVIVSSGLELRNSPSPVGQLPSPLGLAVDLNGQEAVMKVKWKPVVKARGYLLECSPDVHPRQFTQLANTTKAGFEKQMVAGETYVFRVAASGGSTGQSYWSPEVIRGAA